MSWFVYFLANYAVLFVTGIIGCFALIWAISSFGYGKRWGGLHKSRRIAQTGVIAVLVGGAAGYFYADSNLITDRRTIINEMYGYRSRLISQENRTSDIWAEIGFVSSNRPNDVPLLLIEEKDWRIWTTDSAALQGRISDRFNPNIVKVCGAFHALLISPRPAAFQLNKAGVLAANASWNKADLNEIYKRIDECIFSMTKAIKRPGLLGAYSSDIIR